MSQTKQPDNNSDERPERSYPNFEPEDGSVPHIYIKGSCPHCGARGHTSISLTLDQCSVSTCPHCTKPFLIFLGKLFPLNALTVAHGTPQQITDEMLSHVVPFLQKDLLQEISGGSINETIEELRATVPPPETNIQEEINKLDDPKAFKAIIGPREP